MKQIKAIVEKHPDGYVAYPAGLKGIVVGEGDTCEEVLADVRSAIQFHIDNLARKFLQQIKRTSKSDRPSQATRQGWPHRRSLQAVRRPGRPAARGGPTRDAAFVPPGEPRL